MLFLCGSPTFSDLLILLLLFIILPIAVFSTLFHIILKRSAFFHAHILSKRIFTKTLYIVSLIFFPLVSLIIIYSLLGYYL